MRKKLAVLFSLVLATLISMSTLGSVQAGISSNWIGPTYRGPDAFYVTTVVAYETGSEATLFVSVYNDWSGRPVNVSAVKVGFDWGINYSSTECSEASPVQIKWNELDVFTVVFTVPETTVASNLVTHNYRIYTEYVNSTTGPKKIVDRRTIGGYPPFAVYSADQADAQLLLKEWTTWDAAYRGRPPLYIPSEARELQTKSDLEKGMGDDSYLYGNFTDAKIHYGNALDFIKEAVTSEVDTTSNFEDALLGLVNSAGSYLSMQGFGFILIGIGFGIGFLLMGIGVAIYLTRKSKTPTKA